jgi:type III secretion system YscQ/HrcQ family protein
LTGPEEPIDLSHPETISTMEAGLDSDDALKNGPRGDPAGVAEPLGWLPRLSAREVRLDRWLSAWGRDGRLPPSFHWLEAGGPAISIERPEVLWRASGLNRPGLIAQFHAPRLSTRLGLGIENALAHAIVDRLLGFDRPFAESRLQLTPVEWGVWTFLVLRAVDAMAPCPAIPAPEARDRTEALRPGDLTLDRAGPDAFNPAGLGPMVTVRWSVRVGATVGSVRLWLPESVVERWLDAPFQPTVPAHETARRAGRGDLSSHWRAEAGTIAMPRGLKRMRVGGVLPLTGSRLAGTPASPAGPIDLVLDLNGPDGRYRIPVQPVADSGGRLVRLEDALIHEPRPREPILVNVKESRTMSQPSTAANPSAAAPEADPLDVPVTLTVELGRVNLLLSRLAGLKPGDVIELGRHSRAPVELTSNGRLVARGELVLIDTDLGVRVTSVFL